MMSCSAISRLLSPSLNPQVVIELTYIRDADVNLIHELTLDMQPILIVVTASGRRQDFRTKPVISEEDCNQAGQPLVYLIAKT